ncbi:hypothetical protein PENSPDRAFT_735504 [Peniophora sp. CONT]|nr:hypothetical protein PENSPDRAFT_735504 [Peniophora sp. CONT]
MLAFPTPRPPAQVRRASAQSKSEPPPPYVHDISTEVASYAGDVPHMPASPWDGQSRQELAGLLTRADGLIRQRERELSFTSDLSRELNSNNQTLRQTHQALLARLPASAISPANSPFISSRQGSPHFYGSSLPRNSSDILESLRSQTSTPARHARRVSISPGELARLADENAELLSRLDELQEESEHADQAGKRRLGKLEDELSVLRRELEEARARSETLEEHNLALQRDSAEAQLRKQEREERMNDARSKVYEPATPLPDFAPSTTMILPSNVPRRMASSSTVVPFAPLLSPQVELLEDPDARSSQASHTPSEISRATSPAVSIGPREHALVAQLLSKVRELEEANEQISRHQQDTTSKLRSAQLEANAIKRLYEYLDENTEIDIQDGDGPGVEATPTPNSFVFPARDGKAKTIRFRSLRRSLNGELSRFDFEAGIDGDMHSTLRSAQKMQPPKRKALAGLFDSPGRASTATGSSTVFEEPRAAASDDGGVSPALSSLSLPDDAPAPTLLRRKTLGSELGSDFGDVFTGGGTSGHHYHTSSIFESPSAASSVPVTPSEPPTALRQPAFPFPATSVSFPAHPYEEPQTPTSAGGNARMRRLSQTVRARTHRWVDRRHHDSFQSMRLPPDTVPETQTSLVVDGANANLLSVVPASPLPSTAAIDRMFDAVDAAMDRITQVVVPVGVKVPPRPESQSTATVIPSPTKPTRPLSRRKQLAAVMIEVWLWLQFAIIVLVFVYAMARRGPKSILKDAERKRRKAL